MRFDKVCIFFFQLKTKKEPVERSLGVGGRFGLYMLYRLLVELENH